MSLSGREILARADALARLTAEPGRLTRLYLTPEHADANRRVAGWMARAGMAVRQDAVGNIIGRWESATPGAPCVMLGSHLDTVRDAGRYDGIYGVLAALACVEALNARGVRLPFAVEVIGFGDEEGTRFQSTLIGSRAVAGTLDPALLAARDADGITLAEAMTAWGLDPGRLDAAARRPDEVLAYVELHIEQGPVLEALGVPVGIVTSIAGATRLSVTVQGTAGHAGTVPMDLRRDALAAAAEMVLAVERECQGRPRLVGTVGRLTVAPGAGNVIPGEVMFSVDLRADDDAVRADRLAAITGRFQEIAARRGVTVSIVRTHDSPAVACDPGLRAALAAAARAEGLEPPELPSGAGHDAMAMAALCPVAMLFVRCKGGISHHPDESLSAADAEAGARVLLRFLETWTPA